MKDESTLDGAEVGGNLEGKYDFGFIDFDFDGDENRQRKMFDQGLTVFWKEVSSCKFVRPLPALCGDGHSVDLFKLFVLVRKLGGYDVICRNHLWRLVVEECGLGYWAVASVKLIYMKYLHEFDQWLIQVANGRSFMNKEDGVIRNLELLSQELNNFRGSSSHAEEGQKEFRNFDNSEGDRNREGAKWVSHKSESSSSDIAISEANADAGGNIDDHEGKLCINNEIALAALGVTQKVINEDYDAPEMKIDNDFQDDGTKKVTAEVFSRVVDSSRDFTDTGNSSVSAENDDDASVSTQKAIETSMSRMHDSSEEATGGRQEMVSAGSPINPRKRKHEISDFSRMLNWIRDVAKRTDDPSIGRIPDSSKWKDYGREEFWAQALLVRGARLVLRSNASNEEESLIQGRNNKKKQRMHPMMYEENGNLRATELLRCSKRQSHSTKSQKCSCCSPCSAPQIKLGSQEEPVMGFSPKELTDSTAEVLATEKTEELSRFEIPEKEISIGPDHQADVPKWTGVVYESDPKWLGTQLWPPADGNRNSIVAMDPIGKGSKSSCKCLFPGSTDCVQFHISEERMRLKLELGNLFFTWKFHHMGEEVSLSWTAGEETNFKKLIKSTAPSSKSFWNHIYRFFPSKTREKLVSYYFNVYVLRRRSYQNRVTPRDIDSDEDKTDFGSVGDGFGHKAIHVPGTELVVCNQNKERPDV